jgi:hypothetical protein
MSKNKLLILAVICVLALVAGSIFIIEVLGPGRSIVLDARGVAGMTVYGEVEVDGVVKRVEGTLPAKFNLEGKHVKFTFVNDDPKNEQTLELNIAVDGAFVVGARSPSGVQGEVFRPRLLVMRQRAYIGSLPSADAEGFRERMKAQ